MKFVNFVSAVCLLLVGCMELRAEETKMPMAKNPPPVIIDATRVRYTKQVDGYEEYRKQKVQIEITARNSNLNVKEIDGLTMHYWVLAQSAEDRKVFKVIDIGKFDVKLDNTPTGREMGFKGKEVTMELDNTGLYRYGYTYKGFVLVLVNAKNEVVAVKSNQPTWQTNFQRAFGLKTGTVCDLNLQTNSAGPT